MRGTNTPNRGGIRAACGTNKATGCARKGGHMYEKAIIYDPETRDFAMYLDGELVGFARTYQEAEVTLDQLILELLSGTYVREAA
jgi:hypothetical protein